MGDEILTVTKCSIVGRRGRETVMVQCGDCHIMLRGTETSDNIYQTEEQD